MATYILLLVKSYVKIKIKTLETKACGRAVTGSESPCRAAGEESSQGVGLFSWYHVRGGAEAGLQSFVWKII